VHLPRRSSARQGGFDFETCPPFGEPSAGSRSGLSSWVSTVPYLIPERTFDDVSTSRSATAGTRQQRASRRPRLPNQSFSDLLSGAEKPGGISAFLPKLHSVLL